MQGELRRTLAERYFPESHGRVAVARMRRWIDTDPQLRDELKKAGYTTYVHRLAPPVVAVLDKYLG